MKFCSKCHIEKDDSEFVKDRNVCKLCRKEQSKQYYQNNAEVIKEQIKQYKKDNQEKIKKQNEQYRKNNTAEIRKQNKQYYENNAETIKERKKQYRKDNQEKIKQYYQNNYKKIMLRGARRRSKEKNLPFSINEEDIVIPSVCPVLGITLEAGIGKGVIQSNSPSLDRIVPEKGYVKGNIIVISYRANTIKNNATPEEIISVGEYYKKLLEEAKKNE